MEEQPVVNNQIQQPPVNPVASKPNHWLIAIIILVIIFIVGGVYVLALQSQEQTLIPIPLPAETSVKEQDSTANWKTYKNERFGFELKHPDNSVLAEEQNDGILFSVKDRPCNLVPSHKCATFMWIKSIYVPSTIKIEPNKTLEIENVIKERFSPLPGFEVKEFEISAEESNWGTDMVKKITFGKEDIQGYLIHHWLMNTGECIYFGKQNNSNIEISRSAGGLINFNCGDDLLFSQILSTFKFD